MATLENLEDCLDLENPEILALYMSWDKGDCSKVGLAKIILYQEIIHELKQREHYDGEFDELLRVL